MRKLLGYQSATVFYAVHKQQHPALFLEMRLGKTLCTIRSIQKLGCRRVLVVAPLSVLSTWEEELELEKQTAVVREPCASGWCLVNYEFLRTHPEWAFQKWDAVVLDESTRIRNPQAQITKLCVTGFRDTAHRFLLSGLPAPEGLMDYFCQLQFLDGEVLGFRNYYEFRHRYFRLYGFEWRPTVEVRSKIRAVIQQRCFVLRRSQVGQRSEPVYERRVLELKGEQKKLYREGVRTFCVGEKETKWSMVLQTYLARLAGGFLDDRLVSKAKFTELLDLLQGDLREQKVVVFFRFNAELAHAAALLREEKVKHYWINGSVSPADRKARRLSFAADRGRSVLLCQIKCATFGLNLSAASAAVYYSNSFSFEERAQSEMRILHPSKKEPPLYVDLVVKDTVDELVVQALREKKSEGLSLLVRVNQLFKRKLHEAIRDNH